MLTDDEIEAYLDDILRASGSSLRHYSMHKSMEEMIGRVRNVERAAAERMRQRCMAVCSALADALPTFDFNELSPDNVLRDEAFYTAYDAIAEIKIEGEAP